MMTGTLYIFSGLPASGKSTLAKELAKKIQGTYLRIDTMEQGLKDLCGISSIEGEGYRLTYLLAQDNLRLGNKVIADSVNPWELTRKEWNQVATDVGAHFQNIEIICSDPIEHRHRVENRKVGVKNLKLPTWEQVINRDYHQWNMQRIQIDTAGKSIQECLEELLGQIS
jgi:predicted kinase